MIKKYKVGDIRNNKGDTENTFYISSDGILKIVGVFEEPIDCRDFYEAFFSTGLTDKNGVEIYEGDVVRYESISGNDDDYSENIEEVQFFEGAFYPTPIGKICEDDYYSVYKRNYEIIGHIKTHPELLKNNE